MSGPPPGGPDVVDPAAAGPPAPSGTVTSSSRGRPGGARRWRETRAQGPSRRRFSGVTRYALQRALMIPVQLVFVLFVLYLAIDVPAGLAHRPPESLIAFNQGFFQLVFNTFTGNWGTTVYSGGQTAFLRLELPWTEVFSYYLGPSVQLALFALPIAAALAYPLSLAAGWSRRPGLDVPSRFITLTAGLLPVFVVGTLVLNALFNPFLNFFQDVPSQGLIPADFWFFDRGGYPPWIVYEFATRPTGLPLIDALLHHAWTIAAISFTKTLIQGSVVAIAYVAIFFRHARSIARSAREEVYIVGARSRGVSERTLLWRHAARAVTPSFLLIFALTIPEYLGVQFAVEVAFADQSGFGYLIFASLMAGDLSFVVPLVLVLAIVVLLWALAVDLIAFRLDPRGLGAQ